MENPGVGEVFFAYAGQPALRAETMRETVTSLGRQGITASSWQDLHVVGNILLSAITKKIDACAAVVAEVSTNNNNVLFEAGYALAKGKTVWLALDNTDERAERNWSDLSIVKTIGRITYSGTSNDLARQVAEQYHQDGGSLLSELLVSARPREASAVFAPAVPTRFQTPDRLESYLARRSDFKFLASGDDMGLAPLSYYAGEIYRSSAALIHLLGPTRRLYKEHNARASLLAGFAHGFAIPMLMIAEEGFESPLDYHDLLFKYPSTAAALSHVKAWLDGLPTSTSSPAAVGRLSLKVELPINSFGQYVAENESESLDEYFIETSEYQSVLTADSAVFVGRKGTGKTATMTQARSALSRDRRNLVVAIKPSSYELARLIEVLEEFKDTSSREYFLLQLWTFLLVTEVARTVVHRNMGSGAQGGGSSEDQELIARLEALGIHPDDDFSTRLDHATDRVHERHSKDEKINRDDISRELRTELVDHLRGSLRRSLKQYSRVCILVDNLDKTWESGINFEVTSKFLLSLLATSGRLRKEFARSSRDSPSANVTTAIFLRTDIYDVISRHAREPDKISPLTVEWHDEELLARVLEERYLAKRKGSPVSGEQMWSDLFAPEVRGLLTRDYLLWRTLPRPRDIIFLANASLTRAINRKHSKISESDVTFAEGEYSKFAVDALVVESEAQGFDLLAVLLDFAGLGATLTEEDVDLITGSQQDSEAVKNWLLRTSFLGLEVRDGEFVHVEGSSAALRKLKVARRLAASQGRGVRFRIHPAFRNYLEIRDDDLHDDQVRDITLETDS